MKINSCCSNYDSPAVTTNLSVLAQVYTQRRYGNGNSNGVAMAVAVAMAGNGGKVWRMAMAMAMAISEAKRSEVSDIPHTRKFGCGSVLANKLEQLNMLQRLSYYNISKLLPHTWWRSP
jgi:hypothetical protein